MEIRQGYFYLTVDIRNSVDPQLGKFSKENTGVIVGRDHRIGIVNLYRHNEFFKANDVEINITSPVWSMTANGVLFEKNENFHNGNFLINAYAVLALWLVKTNSESLFLISAKENAYQSVANEKGCLFFGVFGCSKIKNTFCLLEIFSDESCFDQHLLSSHFNIFSSIAKPLYIGDKSQTLKGDVIWNQTS